MCHHGNGNGSKPKELLEAMKNFAGTYPDGKLNEQDQGALALMISNEPGIVKLEFAKPVDWIAFTPDEAIAVAQAIIDNARKAAKGSGSIITLTL